MITNERQYRITKNAVGEFEEALARLEMVEADRPPEVRFVRATGLTGIDTGD